MKDVNLLQSLEVKPRNKMLQQNKSKILRADKKVYEQSL